MLFIKHCRFALCIIMVALVSACSPMKSKNNGDNITPLDETEMQTTTDYAEQNEEGQKPAGQDGDASGDEQQVDTIEPDLTIEQRFGVNPYLANPPVVAPDAQAAFSEALSAIRSEDTVTAAILLQQMTVNYPELSGPAYNLAVIYYQQDKPEEALQAIDQALTANENNLNARNLQAKIYRDNSEFVKAEEAYLDILDRWGGYLAAYKNLGIMFDLYMGQQEQALKYYKLYNKYSPEEDRQVIGWQMVIERHIKVEEMQQKAAAEQQVDEAPVSDEEQPVDEAESSAEPDETETEDADAQLEEQVEAQDADMQDQEVQP